MFVDGFAKTACMDKEAFGVGSGGAAIGKAFTGAGLKAKGAMSAIGRGGSSIGKGIKSVGSGIANKGREFAKGVSRGAEAARVSASAPGRVKANVAASQAARNASQFKGALPTPKPAQPNLGNVQQARQDARLAKSKGEKTVNRGSQFEKAQKKQKAAKAGPPAPPKPGAEASKGWGVSGRDVALVGGGALAGHMMSGGSRDEQ
jgi:hypothetical protein